MTIQIRVRVSTPCRSWRSNNNFRRTCSCRRSRIHIRACCWWRFGSPNHGWILSRRFLQRLASTAQHSDRRVVLRTALALGQTEAPAAGKILAKIAEFRRLGSVGRSGREFVGATPRTRQFLAELLKDVPVARLATRFADRLVDHGASRRRRYRRGVRRCLRIVAGGVSDSVEAGQPALPRCFGRRNRKAVANLFRPLYGRAIAVAKNENEDEAHRCEALQLVGIGIESAEQEKKLLLAIARTMHAHQRSAAGDRSLEPVLGCANL